MGRKAKNSSAKPGLTFRNLADSLSNAVGEHQIPVVRSATHPAKVISPEAVHYDLVKKLFRAVYRANRCFHLNAPVDFERTFDVLGEFHGELISSDATDIDQMRLIQDIGHHAIEFFRTHGSVPDELEIKEDVSQAVPFQLLALTPAHRLKRSASRPLKRSESA